jgi:hypothetical protein
MENFDFHCPRSHRRTVSEIPQFCREAHHVLLTVLVSVARTYSVRTQSETLTMRNPTPYSESLDYARTGTC